MRLTGPRGDGRGRGVAATNKVGSRNIANGVTALTATPFGALRPARPGPGAARPLAAVRPDAHTRSWACMAPPDARRLIAVRIDARLDGPLRMTDQFRQCAWRYAHRCFHGFRDAA